MRWAPLRPAAEESKALEQLLLAQSYHDAIPSLTGLPLPPAAKPAAKPAAAAAGADGAHAEGGAAPAAAAEDARGGAGVVRERSPLTSLPFESVSEGSLRFAS